MISIQNGVVHIHGEPCVLVSADYPYYRDKPENWADRLTKLKNCNVNVISFYIPWRHHQLTPDSAFDFVGRTQGNRDVMSFIRLCGELGLWTIAKPGPFIHAETNYGGLPNWVSPVNNPAIEPMANALNLPATWSGAEFDAKDQLADWLLPAPFDPTFLALTQQWLKSVGQDVIVPFAYPHGPIILTQIANEGIYSNGAAALWDYDYSRSGVALYQQHLMNQYGSLDGYNAAHQTDCKSWEAIQPPRRWEKLNKEQDALSYMDWGRFQPEYTGEIFRTWGRALNVDLPMVVNQNPPRAEDFGMDAWLTRVQPECWPEVHYGFTNWIGNVSADATAFDRYLVTARRSPGVNLEENWGFSKLYDPAYIDSATSYYQTLLAFAGGATGFNVCTGVNTADWNDNLDKKDERPYPDSSPIEADGNPNHKAKIVKWLSEFFNRYGAEFLSSKPSASIAWGLYLPYAYVAAWLPAEHEPDLPVCGRGLQDFQQVMRQTGTDYGLVNLETVSLDELKMYPRLVLHGSRFMAQAAQEKLAAYILGGGRLGLLGEVPSEDEHFAPCDILIGHKQSINSLTMEQVADWVKELKRPEITIGKGDVWVRSHPEYDVHFIIALIPTGEQPQLRFTVQLRDQDHEIEIQAAPGSGAIFRVEAGQITDAIVKGHNGYLGEAVMPAYGMDGLGYVMPKGMDFASFDGCISVAKSSSI